ncbi:MAG: DUF4157 domain-containing protein [Gammaproteobacteria bacterium]|nr:DUF4157 domain-containing protein [Gammaproteobacteria bacterium]
MSGKTVTHAATPAATSITTQAQSPVSRHDVDKQTDNPLQQTLWQPAAFTAGTPSTPPSLPGNHTYSFAQIPVVSPSRHVVQAKLTVGEPDDKYEHEADEVADQVMRMPEPAAQGLPDDDDEGSKVQKTVQTKPIAAQITPLIQRQEMEDEEEEEDIQTKLIQRQETEDEEEEEEIQTKLIQRQEMEDEEEEEEVQPKLIQRQEMEDEEEEELQTKLIQRQEMEDEEEEEEIQTKLIQRQEMEEDEEEEEEIQTKLIQRQEMEDEEEEELQTKLIQRQEMEDEEEEELQTKLIQRQEMEEDEEEEEPVQMKSGRRKSKPRLDKENEDYINSVQGQGQPLMESERGFFEPRFGHSFSRVRVHTDGRAAQTARQINAQAFTIGRDIFFGAGHYQPATTSGRQLLAHELTHTIQQSGISPLPGNQTLTKPERRLSASIQPLNRAAFTTQSTSELGVMMRKTEAEPMGTTKEDSVEDLVEWIVDFLKETPEDTKGVVNTRLAGLPPGKMMQVLEQVQQRMASERPLPREDKQAEDKTAESENKATSQSDRDANEAQARNTQTEDKVGEDTATTMADETESVDETMSETSSDTSSETKPDKDATFKQAAALVEESLQKTPPTGEEEAASEETGETDAAEVSEKSEATETDTEAEAGEAAGEMETGTSEAEGGAEAPATEGGEELQTGTAEEGESEIEQVLAGADPERAAADEADPVDLALGEDTEETEEAAIAEPDISEPDLDSLTEETAVENEAAIESTAEEDELAAISEAEEPGPPVSGIDSDEPELGGAVDSEGETAELSSAEQNAALDAIGTSVGGSGPPSGGGGGGTAIPEKAPPPVPDVSTMEPGSALSAVGNLPPAQLQQALGGVNSAVGKASGDKRSELAASPPTMERPSGAPQNLYGKGEATTGTAETATDKVEQAPEGTDKPTPEPKPLAELPPSPAEKISTPAVSGSEKGEMTERDVERLSGSISRLPTNDPGLDANAGPAPKVELSGNADPAQADTQREELRAATVENLAQGKKDAAEEMGENTKVFPLFAPETLTATVPTVGGEASGGGGGKGGGAQAAAGGGGEGADMDALSLIAQEEKGSEISAEVSKAQGDMAAKQEEYNTSVTDEKTKSSEEIAELEQKSSEDQARAREDVQADVAEKKGEWTQEQDDAVTEAEEEADGEVEKGKEDINKEKEAADEKSADEIDKGNEEADKEREKAEKTAKEEKNKGEKEKSGFFGWLASKAKAFFNKIKAAIKSAFDFARKMIKKAIEAAKKAAMWAIEQARKAIVAAIKLVGKALIAIGDKLLAAFPEMRERFRNYIQDKVDKAVAKVNEYAEKLKEGVAKALDALAAGLDKLISLLEKGLTMIVDAVAAVVDSAIKFAESVAKAIGAFIALAKDIGAGPIKWISNLGAAVVDGIRNHLWKAFKAAIKEWFSSKLEQVLGLGKTVWDLIKSGGLSLATVGQMAWDGLKAMIPVTLITILVEKLVSMIVPAAGALKLILEGLQAAWGAVSRIIAAFEAFFAFLKAVKGGSAGPKFATALAAAAIAVIDFIANWLLAKLAKGAAKIGGKIKGLAKKIMGRKKGKLKGKKVKGTAKSKAKGKAKGKTKPKGKVKPKGKPKGKPGAKKPKKSNAQKKQDKKDKKKKDQLARIKRAMRTIKANIKSVMPAKQARKIIARVAKQNRIRYKFKDTGKRWNLKLYINPSETSWFKESEERKKVSKLLKSAGRSVHEFYGYLDDLAGIKTLTGNKEKQAARQKVKDDIEAAGGIEQFIDQHKDQLETRKAGGAEEGAVFQDKATENIRKQAEAQGKIVVSEGDIGGKSGGIDVTVIDPKTGEVEAYEVKHGKARATTQRASGKALPGNTESITLDAGEGKRGEGSKGARHLVRNPDDAERLTDPDKRAVLTEGDVHFENQISAITTNIRANLKRVLDYLDEAAKKEPDETQRAKLKSAAEKVRNILAGVGSGLKRIIAQRKSAGTPPDAEKQAIQLLLESSKKQLENVNITDIQRSLTDEGELIED